MHVTSRTRVEPIYSNLSAIRRKLRCYMKYSKTCLKQSLKNRQNKGLNGNGSLMKVKSIAECSPWSILQYF